MRCGSNTVSSGSDTATGGSNTASSGSDTAGVVQIPPPQTREWFNYRHWWFKYRHWWFNYRHWWFKYGRYNYFTYKSLSSFTSRHTAGEKEARKVAPLKERPHGVSGINKRYYLVSDWT
jgi:hypothetical protein